MSGPNLYGVDLFGKPRAPALRGVLSKKFLIPPFSVMNAREGFWQTRKKAWIALGIQSEVGRGGNLLSISDSCEEYRQNEGDYKKREHTASLKGGLTFGLTMDPYAAQKNKKAHKRVQGPSQPGLVHRLTTQAYRNQGGEVSAADCGTSIFDPVLTELHYRWFAPPGGMILDPFAGGSVRGIVAGMTGFNYWGCDLSEVQIAANREQGRLLLAPPEPGPGDAVPVRISVACMRQRFNGCDPDYIRDVCHASCCRSSIAPGGALVTVHPSEEENLKRYPIEVINGLIVPQDGRCPFQSKKTHLCRIHDTGDKPFGCIASPFTLNKNGTLIVRNRYRALKCYEDGRKIPAYIAFRASLVLLFGEADTDRITRYLDAGNEEDLTVEMNARTARKLIENDAIKSGGAGVRWVNGDSREQVPNAPAADYIFSCPPYGDLEEYSKDPRDLSTMDYGDFRDAYAVVIAAAAERLNEDRFATFVVGDFRGDSGAYRNFPADTIRAFRRAGLEFYNQAVLITAVGSLSIRAERQFYMSRKLGTTHQQCLTFVKGSPQRATSAITGESEEERRAVLKKRVAEMKGEDV